MPKIIDRTKLLSDYVNSIKGFRFQVTGIGVTGYRGKYTGFIYLKDETIANVISSESGVEIELRSAHRDKLAKLTEAMTRYEKDSSVDVAIIIVQ